MQIMAPKKPSYGNDSITSLKGADRVRKRPAGGVRQPHCHHPV